MKSRKLIRPADAFLPAALLLSTVLGRDAVAFDGFFALMLVRLCALATAPGLRAAFARQPAMRYAQGSVCAALIAQIVGAAVALPIFATCKPHPLAMIACGLLINIEHIFYEYMYAFGDGGSALLSRGITAALTLTGLLLSSPSWWNRGDQALYQPIYLLVTSGLSALVALVIGLAMGGRPRPKLNNEVLKTAPMSMLQTALYPALAILVMILTFIHLPIATFAPLFAGLILYELCRTPFRRSPAEARPLNRALLIVCAMSLVGILPFALGLRFSDDMPLLNDIPFAFGALLLAAACAFTLYGNIQKRDRYE